MTSIKEMLEYYGFGTLAEFGKAHGMYNFKDSKMLLTEMYEEDTAPMAK